MILRPVRFVDNALEGTHRAGPGAAGTTTHTDTYGYDANNRLITQTTTGTGAAVNA